MLSRNVTLNDKLSPKLYFSSADLAAILQIKPNSAKVLASRYAKSGLFLRLKKNFYCLTQNWQHYTLEQFLQLANLIQVPSYISFMTALSFYEVTTQVQRNFYESAAQKRSTGFDIKGTLFAYYKLKREYYFDFTRQGNMFISTKEKAFVDAVYLYSFGKYKIDFASLDLRKIEKRRLWRIIRVYPMKTVKIVRQLCKI